MLVELKKKRLIYLSFSLIIILSTMVLAYQIKLYCKAPPEFSQMYESSWMSTAEVQGATVEDICPWNVRCAGRDINTQISTWNVDDQGYTSYKDYIWSEEFGDCCTDACAVGEIGCAASDPTKRWFCLEKAGNILCNRKIEESCLSGKVCVDGVCEEPSAVCGNGVRETGEQCDGSDLGGQTCQSQGFDSGSLSCNADCTFNTGGCVGVGFVCTPSIDGSIISNAHLCPGDDQDLTSNTPITLVSGCTPRKCEFICDSGWHKEGTMCVMDSVAGTCSGTAPSGSGVIKGPSQYPPGYSPISWTYSSSASTLTPCLWKCSSGYTRSGNSCVPSGGPCTCSWVDQACNTMGCVAPNRRPQVKECNPPGCDSGFQCIVDPVCIPGCPGATCESLGYECGTHSICSVLTYCGNCDHMDGCEGTTYKDYSCQTGGGYLCILSSSTDCDSRCYYCGDGICNSDCGETEANCPEDCCPTLETCSSLGKECGTWPDGCGGTLNCGPLQTSCTINYGTCVETGTEDCVDGLYDGVCDGTADPRIANCAGKECGDDGCGGVCGVCDPVTEECIDGQCVEICLIESAYWAYPDGVEISPDTEIPEGDLVYLTASSSSDVCNGQLVSFSLVENDRVPLNPDDDITPPAPVAFVNGIAKAPWNTLWIEDEGVEYISNGFDLNPEFFFTASVPLDSKTSNLIEVTRSEGGCSIHEDSLEWSTGCVVAGDNLEPYMDLDVSLSARGSSDCADRTVTFSLHEKDSLADCPLTDVIDDSLSSLFPTASIQMQNQGSYSEASTVFTVEYDKSNDDCDFDDLEYFFTADIAGISYDSDEMTVVYCNQNLDWDCDRVCNPDKVDACIDQNYYERSDNIQRGSDTNCADVCPNTDICQALNQNNKVYGCESDYPGCTEGQASCIALWDCSDVLWSECDTSLNIQTRNICTAQYYIDTGADPDEYPDECCLPENVDLGYCACIPPSDPACQDIDMLPATQKPCFREQPFPFFTSFNIGIVLLILALFYFFKKRL